MKTEMALPRRAFLRNMSAGVMLSYAPLAADTTAGSLLDEFIQRYLAAMNAPGLTLALANKSDIVRTAGFGYSDLDLKTPVTPDLLFEIGSITKSFVALTLLQLREQGKLDLQKPILEYLPWAPIEANYGVITVHHLLTHSSGLPDALAIFPSDPTAHHVQAFAPGTHFHYCNLGFSLLGHLIQKLDGKPWPEAVSSRILEPLGMTSTRAMITDRTKSLRAKSYVPFYSDVVYPRNGRLGRAVDIVFENAAGSITSTPGDMALYLRMLLNRGQSPQRRIVSEESFVLFTTPYIKAPEFGPTSSYGYGIGVDKLDGNTILRHTGGMTSFASSIHVDLDGGVAAFASINAMQGYRPTPVTQFAVQLMNAKARNKETPQPPALSDSAIKDAQDYAGEYTSPAGKRLEVVANGDSLLLRDGDVTIPLEQAGGDTFLPNAPTWDRFPIVFNRADGTADKRQVVELVHGSDWYTNAHYSGERSFPDAPELQPFCGYYQDASAWSGSVRIVLRKGKLLADGVTPLQPIGNALFRMGDEAYTPDTVQFHYLVDGKAQLLKMNGADLWRISEDSPS